MTVLFTCAGRRNYLIQYFKEIIGDGGRTIAVDQDATAPALAEADVALTVPSVFAVDYIESLVEIIRDYEVGLVIPLNDLELPIIAANKKRLEAYGAKVVISHPSLIDLCADKCKTFNFFEDLKIPTTKTFVRLDDVLMALAENNIKFPVILKPRWGFGSVGIEEVANETELRLAYRLLSTRIKNGIMASIGPNTLKNQIIFQEKIDGEEYGIDIVNDFNGNYYGAFAKRKLAMRAGETDKAISVIDSKFSKMAEKIAKATQHIGIMDCDFFLKDGEMRLLEMNPRFGGGYPFSHSAGVNIPGIYLEWLKGNQNVSKYDRYKANITFSKFDRIVKIKGETPEAEQKEGIVAPAGSFS